jgi:hypothetical protein
MSADPNWNASTADLRGLVAATPLLRKLLERIEPVLEAVTRGRALKTAAGDLLPELRAALPDETPEAPPEQRP